jgi:hypothetical protein
MRPEILDDVGLGGNGKCFMRGYPGMSSWNLPMAVNLNVRKMWRA